MAKRGNITTFTPTPFCWFDPQSFPPANETMIRGPGFDFSYIKETESSPVEIPPGELDLGRSASKALSTEL